MAQRHVHHSKIVTAFVRIPKPLEDGKVRCAGCSAVVKLTKAGHLRKHRTPAGEDCAHRATYAPPIHLGELPPVVIPTQPRWRPRTREVREREPSRLDAGSDCQGCGRWLPGERELCAKCQRRRNIEKGRGA